MFFEGSEKKIKVVVGENTPCLRSLGRSFWEKIVIQSEASILSVVQNEVCDAYLLSESSLFVWKNRFVMLTCGNTILVDALLYFLDQFDNIDLQSVCYQRKNEYQPELQKSSFVEDVERLNARLPGKSFRLGTLDSHHQYLYHLDRPYRLQPEDGTFELLMYHIDESVAAAFSQPNQTSKEIRKMLDVDRLFRGFEFDDFVFEPCGYSFNAIKGDRYATLHITPEAAHSYVSFETNLDSEQAMRMLSHFREQLKPSSWDVVALGILPEVPMPSQTLQLSESSLSLSCGFDVRFSHYQAQERKVMQATPLHSEPQTTELHGA